MCVVCNVCLFMVIGEVVLVFVLFVGVSFLVFSYLCFWFVECGFEIQGIVLMMIVFDLYVYNIGEWEDVFYEMFWMRFNVFDGVEVSVVNNFFLSGEQSGFFVFFVFFGGIEEECVMVLFSVGFENYFDVFGILVLVGCVFEECDDCNFLLVVLVNQILVECFM